MILTNFKFTFKSSSTVSDICCCQQQRQELEATAPDLLYAVQPAHPVSNKVTERRVRSRLWHIIFKHQRLHWQNFLPPLSAVKERLSVRSVTGTHWTWSSLLSCRTQKSETLTLLTASSVTISQWLTLSQSVGLSHSSSLLSIALLCATDTVRETLRTLLTRWVLTAAACSVWGSEVHRKSVTPNNP